MLLQSLRTLSLMGLFCLSLAQNIYATFPSEQEWELIVAQKIPLGRTQLESYKAVYTAHSTAHSDSPDLFKLDVFELEGPFGYLYANAYQRLKVFEETNPKIAEIIGEMPTTALHQLFQQHIKNDILSVNSFKGCVLDVVDLMDMTFHASEPFLRKKTLKDLFSDLNTFSENTFFSPVFLKKQGISINSINFAFFGPGPFLAVTEVGPSRAAHDGKYGQTNRRFILAHDTLHNSDTYRFLVRHLSLFSGFQTFYNKIESLSANIEETYLPIQNLLHTGLFLLSHEYVQQIFGRFPLKIESLNLREILEQGIMKVTQELKNSFGEPTYATFQKDSFVAVASAMINYTDAEDKKFYRFIHSNLMSGEHLNFILNNLNFLDDFTHAFIKEINSLLA